MLWIKQANGLDFSTAKPTSPRSPSHSAMLPVFHEIQRAAGPLQQARKKRGPSIALSSPMWERARSSRAMIAAGFESNSKLGVFRFETKSIFRFLG
jgi:hypothetical protein